MDSNTSSCSDKIYLWNGTEINLPVKTKNETDSPKKDFNISLIEKVNNVWGSTAGAGSDFFYTYRKHRSRERERQTRLDQEYQQEIIHNNFQKLRKLNCEKNTEKNKKSRRKVRQLARVLNSMKKGKTQNPFNKFKSDGTFINAVQDIIQPETT